jgi:hypothetical protein
MLKASFLFSLSISKIYTFILSPTFNASLAFLPFPRIFQKHVITHLLR